MTLGQAGPEGTSRLHEEVSQMLLLKYLLSLNLYLWPHKFSIISWHEEKTQTWFIDVSAWYSGITPKRNTFVLHPLSESSQKNSGEGKFSQWAELQAVPLIAHFAWKKKMTRCANTWWLVCYGLLLGVQSETWKEHDWKIGKEVWKRDTWLDFY